MYQGQHEPIISIEDFNAAQKLLKEREKENANRKIGKAYKSPLGGIIYCGNCGSRYHFRSGATNADGTRRNYYICYSRSKGDKRYVKDPNCRNKNYRDNVLDALVFDEIRKLKSEPEYISAVQNSTDNTHKIEMLESRIKQVEGQVSKLMDLYSIGGMDLSAVTDKIKPLNAEKKSLEQELEVLVSTEEPTHRDEIIELVDAFEEVVKDGDCQQIHGIVAALIEQVVIDGEDIRIKWAF